MTALDKNPETGSFLSPLNFRFSLQRAPNLNFYVQQVNLPSITLPDLDIANPFLNIPASATKLSFGSLEVKFKIDEDLQNYMEIAGWIRDLGFPDSFDEYQKLAVNPEYTGNGLKSNVMLLVLDGMKNPNYLITYKDAFPTFLSEAIFNTTDDTVDYVTATARFRYFEFDISKAP